MFSQAQIEYIKKILPRQSKRTLDIILGQQKNFTFPQAESLTKVKVLEHLSLLLQGRRPLTVEHTFKCIESQLKIDWPAVFSEEYVGSDYLGNRGNTEMPMTLSQDVSMQTDEVENETIFFDFPIGITEGSNKKMDSTPLKSFPINLSFNVPEKELKKLEPKKQNYMSKMQSLQAGERKLKFYIEIGIADDGATSDEEKRICCWIYFEAPERDFPICCSCIYFLKSSCSRLGSPIMCFLSENEGRGCAIFTVADLNDPQKKLIVDEHLTIHIKGLFFLNGPEFFKSCHSNNPLAHLLFNNVDQTDFVIVAGKPTEEKNEIYVHKLVLSVRSPVFRAMFSTEMREKAEGKVAITDFNADIVQYAIDFCYDHFKSEKSLNWRQWVDLFEFGDKYDIVDLRQKVEDSAIFWIGFHNFVQIANALVIVNSRKLKELCFHFFLMSMRNGIPVADITDLKQSISNEFMKRTCDIEFC